MSTDGGPVQTPPDRAPHVKTVLRLAGFMQRYAVLLGGVVSVVAIVVAAVLRGSGGAVGSVIGAVIGLAIGAVGIVVMRRTAAATPAGVMIGALTAFAGKFVLLLVFLLIFRGTTLFDSRTFAFTLLAVTAAWIAGEVIGFVRAKVPAVDL
ncbi:hypothetical protein ACFQE5_20450 [Pseudonocardia hispaniensis]|uniref:ATP synthase protein I n=1 Tax=Pseudonocardia hispaniensis TaxID=904933 RepID=A0ABW1J6T0_9PSEU